jgi:hypothetical protein
MSSPAISFNDVQVEVPSSSSSVSTSVQGTTVISSSRDNDFDETDDEVSTGAERCELEGFMPCSKSHLWKLMMSFYERKGPESWSQGIVPHFITCNAFIGRAYAKVRNTWRCLNPHDWSFSFIAAFLK